MAPALAAGNIVDDKTGELVAPNRLVTYTVTFSEDMADATVDAASEVALELAIAELFLHHFGSVILLEDIILMFKLSGRSTENSNIRVTMFQLRFKIEAITRCQFTLVSVYKEGYSLRNSRNYDTDFPFPDLEVRQETAVYTA